MTSDILQPMFVHVIWTGFLYALLTLSRAPDAWGVLKTKDGSNPFAQWEPRVSANLSNQFEWPLFFHIACIILLYQPERVSDVHIWLAWLFIFGRFVHSAVQILTTNIRLRGAVFSINFLAVVAMWMFVLVEI